MSWTVFILAGVLVLALILAGLRWADRRADSAVWSALIDHAGSISSRYDPDMVASLPEPARRYFNFIIQPGAPLYRAVEITMTGELGLGTRDKPGYKPMRARQILAPPYGLVWILRTGGLSGSDGATPDTSWTRFWLFGLIPIIRVSSADHRRSAFGRVAAEAAFWVPASLLPGDHVEWQAIGADRACATLRFGDFTQAITIHVDPDGAPRTVTIERWSNENPDKVFRAQPFGGHLSDFRLFEGYRLPTHVEGGNHIGTDQYFPFFKATVTAIHFPQKGLS